MTGFPVPILFAVQSIRGKARVRLQFIPEPPFVKTVTFALEGYPQVEVNAYVREPVRFGDSGSALTALCSDLAAAARPARRLVGPVHQTVRSVRH